MAKSKIRSMKTALNRVSDNISQLVGELKDDSGDIDSSKLRQLKELTAAAKELSALIKSMQEPDENEKEALIVSFESEADEWAK